MKRTAWVTSTPLASSLVAATLACGPSGPASTPPPDVVDVPGADESQVAVWPDEAFRNQRPEPGPAPELRVPKVERFTLSNGLEVYFLAVETLPVAHFVLDFELGSLDDPRGKAGTTDLCMDLLDESTKALDKSAHKARLDDEALSLSSWSGSETSGLSGQSLARDFPSLMKVTAELLQTPGLRADDFERLQDRAVDGLAQVRASHASVASRVLPSLVYGASHPRGRIVDESQLEKVRVSDCAKVAKRLGPKGARLFVAAKMSRQELESTLEAELGAWKGSAPKAKAAKTPDPELRHVFFVDMPGSVQSTVAVASLGPDLDAPDYAATQIMTRILGGSFSSRINMNLREDKGYTYGGRGTFRYHRDGSHLWAGAGVRADATVPSIEEVLKEIAGVREGPLRPEELSRERDGARAALPGEFGAPAQNLSTFRWLVDNGLPLDWHVQYDAALGALDLDAVETAGRDHLPVDDYLVLVVGDGQVVRADLEAFASSRGLQFVEIDSDGKRK